MNTIVRASLVMTLMAYGASAPAEEATAGAAATVSPAAPEPSATDARAIEASPAAVVVKPSEPAAPVQGQAQVVEGAPLGNANVHVHIVERKPYTNAGHHELVIYPAVAPVNAKFTTHIGAALMYSYHLFENLALQVTPLFNYYNRDSGFNQELIAKGRQQAEAATALLLQYGALGGVEVTPMYGKFAFYQGVLGHFTFVLNAGAGVGSTRIQLTTQQTTNCGPGTDTDCLSDTFGNTGLKFLGSVGAGFRVYLGERAAIRIEVRDLVYTARVDKINGCTSKDVANLQAGQAAENSSCGGVGSFTNSGDLPVAKNLLDETTSDVLNNISVYAGFSFLF